MGKESENPVNPTAILHTKSRDVSEPPEPEWTGEDIAIAMLRAEGLVSHHLDSFNAFLSRLPSLLENHFRAEVRREERQEKDMEETGIHEGETIRYAALQRKCNSHEVVRNPAALSFSS